MAGGTRKGAIASLAWRRIPWLVVVLVGLLLLAVLPPLAFLLLASIHHFQPDGSYGNLTLDHFRSILASGKIFSILLNSATYSMGAAAFALVVGATQAWLAERTDAPLRNGLYFAAMISLGVPYVLYIGGWLLFLGKSGPVNALMQPLLGAAGPPLNIYSIPGMVFVEGMIWSPLAFLMLTSVFRNSDASFEEAAIMSGAGAWKTLRRITLGMAGPALLAFAMIVFIRASEGFEVPALVGIPGSARVFTSMIFQSLHLDIPPNVGEAAAFGVILLVVMAILLRIYDGMVRHAHRYRTITGKGFRPRVIALGRMRPLAGLLIVAVPAVVIGLPLANIIWAAALPYYEPFNVAALSKLTTANFDKVIHSPSFQDTIVNSLLLGAGTATVVCILAGVAGWCVARRVRGSGLIDVLAATPLVFPAIVLSLAFLEIFVHSGTLYGSLTSLVVASSVAFLPYGLRYGQIGVMQIHPELEEAAQVAGARGHVIFLRIIVPLLMPALVSCWLFVFLLAVRAMALVLLLVGPDSHVVAVALFDLWQNGAIGEVAALGCIWTSIMTFFSVLFFVVARHTQTPIG
jgi:iron(III) transport system permease protein